MSRQNQRAGKAVEQGVVTFCRAQGLTIRPVGVRGRPLLGQDGTVHWGTGQAPGLPDYLVTHRPSRLAFFVEVKGGRAQLRPAQREVKADLEAAGWSVVVGDWQAVARHLDAVGYLRIREAGGRVVEIRRAG